MRVLKRSPWLSGLGLVLAVCALGWGQAAADVTSDRAGSIVIYPKVIADGTRDTLIQLANTSNMAVIVHCVYINGAGSCEFDENEQCERDDDCTLFPIGDQCLNRWQETNFTIGLTRQQPTIWRVSTGRVADVGADPDGECDLVDPSAAQPRQACPGIVLGNVIPPNQPFRGELKCVQMDESETPIDGNALKGEALIEDLSNGQISKYNSINIIGNQVDGNLSLELDNVEYNACPRRLEFVHYANRADDLVAEGLGASCGATGCPVATEITLIPCTQHIEDQIGSVVTALYDTYDQQEQPLSASYFVDGWDNRDLAEIQEGAAFDPALRGPILRTVIRSATGTRCIAGPNMNASCSDDDDCGGATNGGVCGPNAGLLGIVEEFHMVDGPDDPNGIVEMLSGTAAANMHMVGSRDGVCRGTLEPCQSDSQCDGLCRDDGASCANTSECDQADSAGLNICDQCIRDTIEIPAIN